MVSLSRLTGKTSFKYIKARTVPILLSIQLLSDKFPLNYSTISGTLKLKPQKSKTQQGLKYQYLLLKPFRSPDTVL